MAVTAPAASRTHAKAPARRTRARLVADRPLRLFFDFFMMNDPFGL
jgi:hypothetical protein